MRIEGIRALEGPNVYHYKPVLVMQLQLEGLTERESSEITGFTDRLLELLPGLRQHVCSRGYAGGFAERLNEGTYFGHVVEHVALELASLLGSSATYGKTLYGGREGLYDVIVRYEWEHGMRFLLDCAVRLVDALAAGEQFPLEQQLEQGRQIIADTRLGPSTQAIVSAAERRGIPWRRLDDGSLVQFGFGVNRKLIQAALTDSTSHLAVDTVADKEQTKALLREAFLPVPPGMIVRDENEAAKALAQLSAPVVVKPLDGNQGRGVSLNLWTEQQVREAYREAASESDRILVEEQLQGEDYRVLVVGGKMVAASLRIPGHVVGDGEHTLEQLIRIANRDPRRGDGHEKPLTKLVLAETNGVPRSVAGHEATYVPQAGEKVMLSQAANLSLGGTAVDVTDAVHPETRRICERAARAANLDICGVDLVTPDISRPLGGGIVELNAGPGLRMHLYPASGTPRAVGEAIMDLLYPSGQDSRIPVCAVTGTNGKTTVTRMIGHILGKTGKTVGMTTTDGIHVGGFRVASGDMTGPASARVVLSDPAVEAAVLEVARGGLLRRGLAHDWSDVGVITNIRPDHLGQDEIETLEDLVRIKSLVAERVREGGTVILNADDIESARLAGQERIRKPARTITFYSTQPDNARVLDHLAHGGNAFFIEDGWIVEARGYARRRVLEAASIPVTFDGTADFQVSNCLAAVAAARAMGCQPELIASALRSFGGLRDNPGRSNVWRIGSGYLVVDYGHNPDAFRAASAMARQWKRPVVGLVGVPGDRSDSLIRESARVISHGFEKVWIREDKDLRGRAPGEVAGLLWHEIRAEAPQLECRIVLDELEAIREVTAEAAAGATALVFYEKLEPILEFLEMTGAQPVESALDPGSHPEMHAGVPHRRRRPVL
jgi:cyanophycin synthetase